MTTMRTLAVLGATGSIGDSTLDVVARHPDRFAIMGRLALESPESRARIAGWRQQPGMLGMRFEYQSPLFAGGLVYVPIGEIPIPLQNGSPVKSVSIPMMGTAPGGFFFFDRIGGAIDLGNFYRSNGTSWQVMDYARNLSQITFAPYGNSVPIPTLPNISSVKANMSSTNLCPSRSSFVGQ
jgi:hypothetical protein